MKYWKHSSFLENQERIIHHVLNGEDTLALLPTGGGKSLCYQIPSLMMDGICLVISPLISLMQDQISEMKERGIKAISINNLSPERLNTYLTNCIYGQYKFLYLSPEKLENKLVQKKIAEMNVNLIAVDEAHCISAWGHNFRPKYRNIASIREYLPAVPILALTATATEQVARDIKRSLNFKSDNVIRSSFIRKNISYVVTHQKEKEKELLRVLKKINGSSIVYARSRQECIQINQLLIKNNIKSEYYHAGVDIKERIKKQSLWRRNKIRIMVATNAFGMGINKLDVRLIVHMHIPINIESYYQETGRAGRDKKNAHAIMIYNDYDIEHLKKIVVYNFPLIEEIKELYQNLANFFHLPVNHGMNETFHFNIKKFSVRYDILIHRVDIILRYLEKYQYLKINDIMNNESKIKFLVTHVNLNNFQDANRYYNQIITTILRSYTGLFDSLVKINEETIAAIMSCKEEKIINDLIKLEELEIIKYSRKEKGDKEITYIQNRLEKKHVVISEKEINRERDRCQKKIRFMINYCQQNINCRSKELLLYFGEDKEFSCGKCDLCKKNN